jgi:predicted nucleotidyltransferase
MITPEDLQKALDTLDRRFGLDNLWLFGSEAQGTARPDSDVDLAALFKGNPTPVEVFEAQGELAAILGRDVDLVNLDRVSPILARQVLRNGQLMIDRNPKRRYAFFSRTISMYEDMKIQRREVERKLLERFAGG